MVTPNLENEDEELEEILKNGTRDERNGCVAPMEIEYLSQKPLIYGVTESPPVHVAVVCALQQVLLSLSGQLIVSLLVAEAVCASDNNAFKSKLLSSTLFMSGLTTLAMNVIGIRLPLFQGATSAYIVPLLLVSSVDDTFCSSLSNDATSNAGGNASLHTDVPIEKILNNVRAGFFLCGFKPLPSILHAKMAPSWPPEDEIQGSIMIAGVIHALFGFTGLIGVLIRYVGPLTIVPTMMLMFIAIAKPVLKFVEVNWGIALSTIAVALILFLYLAKYNMPIPVWTPTGGRRIKRYPLHQVFAIMISILINWSLCGILTVTGVLTDDPNNIGYNARTDARSDVIADKPWFYFPYPGQFGPIGFHSSAFIACMVATLVSILDSIGDYYACARVCRVPAPPVHAVNRGILTEGVCTFISGAVGCGHATSTYGSCIGVVGVTKIASRQVFIFTGVLYMLFGIFGKVSAVFICIPYPVLGGAIIVLYGTFLGVIISNLEVVKMSSQRNMTILGLAVLMGLLIPTWVQKVKTPINTGNNSFDRIMSMLLSNPNLCGTIIAFILDNTVPGTREERGIAAWHVGNDEDASKLDPDMYNEGYEVYNPLVPERMLRWRVMKYVPFLPHRQTISETPESAEDVI